MVHSVWYELNPTLWSPRSEPAELALEWALVATTKVPQAGVVTCFSAWKKAAVVVVASAWLQVFGRLQVGSSGVVKVIIGPDPHTRETASPRPPRYCQGQHNPPPALLPCRGSSELVLIDPLIDFSGRGLEVVSD